MRDSTLSNRAVYRSYSQEELDRQYDQRSLVPYPEIYKQHKIAASNRVRATLTGIYDIRYGGSEDEVLDVFPATERGGPSVVFLHGGAWKAGHKDESSYVAECFVEKGVNVVIPNFSLVPDVRLSEQIRQAASAVYWVHENAAQFGGDPESIFVVGHSSGAHLVGMMAVRAWIPPGLLKGAAAFSGMFDLEPVRLSWRNSYLCLSTAEAEELSPIRMIPDNGIPIVVGCGSGELDEFRRQSREFAAAWRRKGNSCEELIFNGLNHFEVQELLSVANGPVVKAICNLMKLKH